MAFPTVGLISTFSGGDEDPLSDGGKYLRQSATSAGNPLQVVSGGVCSSIGTFGASFYQLATFDAGTVDGVENYIDCTNKSTGGRQSLQFYINAPSDTLNGYEMDSARTANTWRIKRVTASSGSAIGADVTQVVSAGDGIGMLVRKSGSDTIIDAYYRSGAGSWTLLFSRTDTGFTDYAVPGYIGISQQFGPGGDTMDNHGGGQAISTTTQEPFSLFLLS